MEGSDVDGCLVMMTAFYLGRVITIITGSGIWSSEQTVNHDIVLLHRGGNHYINSLGKENRLTFRKGEISFSFPFERNSSSGRNKKIKK